MEDLCQLRLPRGETVGDRSAGLMEAAAAGLASREHVSVWAEELKRLAVDVCSLPATAHGAIRTVLDSVALEDAVEAEEAKHLRNEIDALKRGSAKLGLALLGR
jgi:hypothetical protein